MTMDLHHHQQPPPQQQQPRGGSRCSDSPASAARGSPCSPPASPVFTPLRPPAVTSVSPPSGVKRSFDVAFLVAPDERRAPRPPEPLLPQDLTQRSAFTKVGKVMDLSADRLSPYPPSPPRSFLPPHKQYPYPLLMDHKEKMMDNYLLKTTASSSMHTTSLSYSNAEKDQLFKLRPMLYPAEAYISAAYPYAAAAAANFVSTAPQTNGTTSPSSVTAAARAAAELLRPSSSSNTPVVSAPFLAAAAAAISPAVTSLLPPSLAALSLPAQNVCAKCNLSFRMTSDLVYHMRSHHKAEAQDPLRRRREEKLKCPVCSESFRERHHLTRHMTAHQDKAGDEEEHPVQRAVAAGPHGHLITGK